MNKEKFFEFCYNIAPKDFPETVIITPFIPLKAFSSKSCVTKSFKGSLFSGIITKVKSRPFAVIFTGMGDRLAADGILLMEKTPVEKIIFVGACGGLGKAFMGEIIIPESAFNGEGFSQYHDESFSMKKIFASGKFANANKTYTKSLEQFASGKLKTPNILKKGAIFTIGSFLAETQENLSAIEQKNFIGIDLELSAVYRAASVIGRKAAALIVVSDLPKTKPLWEKPNAIDKKKYTKNRNKLIDIAIEFATEE